MKTLLLILLITHVTAGFTALVVGLIPMFFEKGNRLHKRAGLLYVYCMIIVAVTALLLCGLQPFKMMRLFLTGIAVFSFYLCITGWRATKQKKSGPNTADKALTFVTLFVSVAMIGFGVYLLTINGLSFLPIVFTFFGVTYAGICRAGCSVYDPAYGEDALVLSALHPHGWLLYRYVYSGSGNQY